MEGIPDPPEHRGVTPRSFEHIFQEVAVRENTKFLVRASYLEIYNEQIRDLLSPNSKHGLDLKEHPDKGVYVKDLSLNPVHTASDMIKLMAKGTQNRSVGATLMNADSSRSHSIFTVWVEMAETGADGEEHIRVGKLNLVDLAGSERQSKTGASGERFKEVWGEGEGGGGEIGRELNEKTNPPPSSPRPPRSICLFRRWVTSSRRWWMARPSIFPIATRS